MSAIAAASPAKKSLEPEWINSSIYLELADLFGPCIIEQREALLVVLLALQAEALQLFLAVAEEFIPERLPVSCLRRRCCMEQCQEQGRPQEWFQHSELCFHLNV